MIAFLVYCLMPRAPVAGVPRLNVADFRDLGPVRWKAFIIPVAVAVFLAVAVPLSARRVNPVQPQALLNLDVSFFPPTAFPLLTAAFVLSQLFNVLGNSHPGYQLRKAFVARGGAEIKVFDVLAGYLLLLTLIRWSPLCTGTTSGQMYGSSRWLLASPSVVD